MNGDWLPESFEVIAEAPGGVKRLRELILQLAVRGRLVPHDPADEPASVLLEQIAGRRSRRGRRDTGQQLTIGPDDEPYPLPLRWAWVRLADLGTIVGGSTPKSNVAHFWADRAGIPWVTPADLRDLRGRLVSRGRRDITKAGLESCSTQLLPEGSVLFSSRAPIGYVAIAANPIATNQGFKSCVPYVRGMSDYLYWYLTAVAPEVDRNAPGTTFREVSGKLVSAIPVALPPLREQYRIVARVDELMALCDELEEKQERVRRKHARVTGSSLHHLAKAQDLDELARAWERVHENFDLLIVTAEDVQALRDSILQLATCGRLVPQDPADEPAGVSGNPEAGAAPRPPACVEEEGLVGCDLPVPDTWRWVRFGDVVRDIEAGWSPRCEARPRSGAEWGVLKVSSVSWGKFRPEENKSLPAHLEPRLHLEVQRGDFLMSRANTADLVGRSVIVEDAPPRLLLCDKTLRVAVTDWVDPRYLNLFNNSPLARAYYSSTASGTSSSMRNLSRDQIRSLPVALPPVAEQRRIVSRVEELIALCDDLEAGIVGARAKSERAGAALVAHGTAA